MDWRYLVVLALGITCSRGSLDKAFSPEREYVYQYEAQLATGIPESTNFYSGLKIICQTRFQFKTVSRVTMKLEKVMLYQLNNRVEGEDPTREQVSVYQQISGQEADWMTKYLIKPVTFKYMRGNVMDIKSEDDDEYWSMNVKRGILSLLEMNFEERRRSSQRERLVELQRDRSSNIDYYKVMEPSVAGDCETTYHVETDVPNEQENYMYLTKVRNYLNCLERPVYSRSIFNAIRCAQCENERTEPYKSASQIRYIMKGDRRRFMIYSAIGENQHVFTPYSPEGGNVATYINQTFVLINQKDIESVISEPRNPRSHPKGLQAEQEKDREVKSPLTSRPPPESPKRSNNERKQRIMKYIDLVVTYSKDDVSEEATSMTFTLTDELRYAPSDVIREIWSEYKEGRDRQNSDKYYKWKLMLDVLPMLGTPSAVEVLFEYIRKSEIHPDDAAVALNTLTVTAYPDINIAKYILEFVRDQNMKGKEMMIRSAYLTMGAIADRIRNEKEREERRLEKKAKLIQELSDRENKRHIRDQLKSKLKDARDELEQLTSVFSRLRTDIVQEIRSILTSSKHEIIMYALKSIGNTGFPEFLPDLQKFFEDRSKPVMIRTQAIFGLRKIASYAPESVRMMLMPLFFEQEEIEDIRIAAYMMMTNTKPDRPFLEMIAQSLYRERNPHVGTFVFTHLEQLSNSTHPCLMSWARNATFALRSARRFSPSYHYSSYFHFSHYYDNIKSGGAVDVAYISSAKGFVPRAMAVHTNLHVLGYSSNIMEMGFNTEGLQKAVEMIMKPSKASKDMLSVLEGLRAKLSKDKPREDKTPEEEHLQPSKLVQDIHKLLKVALRESPDLKGHFYFKMFNNEIRYFDLYDIIDMAVQLKERVDSKRSFNLDFYKSTMLLEGQYSWFTEIGFPINYKLKASSAFRLGGSWGLGGSERSSLPTIKFDLTPSMAVQMRGVVETDFYYFKSGAAITSQLQYGAPVSMKFSSDSRKYYFKLDLPKDKENFMRSEVSPTFFFERHYLETSKLPLEDLKYLEYMEGAKVYPVNYEYGNHEFGIVFGVKGQMVFRDFNKGLPFYPFYGRNAFQFTLRPGVNPPKAWEFQFMYNTEKSKPKHESMEIKSEDEQVQKDDSQSLMSSFMNFFMGSKEESDKMKWSGWSTDKSGVNSKSRDRGQRKEGDEIESSGSGQGPKKEGDEIESSGSGHGPKKEDRRNKITSKERIPMKDGPKEPRESKSIVDRLQSRLKQVLDKQRRKGFYSFMFRMEGVGCNPERWYNFDIKYSPTDNERHFMFDFSLSRSPFPEKEQAQYNMEFKGSVMCPEVDIEPRDLLSEAYQKENEKLIKRYIQQHGEKEALPEILKKSSTSSNSKPVRPDRVLRRLVDEVVQKESEQSKPELQQLIELVRDQKEVFRKLKQLRKQRHNVLDVQSKVLKVRDGVEKLSSVNERIEKYLVDRPLDEVKNILIKSVLLQQQENIKHLVDVVSSLRGSIKSRSEEELSKREEEVKKETFRLIEIMVKSSSALSPRTDASPKVQSLEEEQSKQLKDLIDSPKQLSKEQLEKLIKRTTDTISQLSLDDIRKIKDSKRVHSLLKALIQHEQIKEMIKSVIREHKPEDKHPLKDIVPKLESLSKVICKIIQISEKEPKSEMLDDRDDHEKVAQVKLAQLQVELYLQRDSPIDKEQATKIVDKLEDISRKIAKQVDKVSDYSRLMRHLQSVCRSQIRILDQLKRKLKDKSQKQVVGKIEQEKRRIVDVEQSLIKRVKSSIPEPESMHSSPVAERSRNMFFTMDISFGYTGLAPKMVTIKGMTEKSLEQLLWEAKQSSPDKDEMVQRYLEEKDRPDAKLRDSYRDLKRALNAFRHFHFIVKYNKADFEPYYRMMFWRFQENFKYYWYPHVFYDMPKFTSDRLEFMFDLWRNDRQMDATFYTPLETDRFMSINVPWSWVWELFYRIDRLKLVESMPRRSQALSFSRKLPGECIVRDRSVKTLDDHVMVIPETGSCDVVLAMDCSSSGQYAIKARKDKQDPKMKIITLSVGEKEIEVEVDSIPLVRQDGKVQTLKDGEQIEIKLRRQPYKEEVLVRVSKHQDQVRIELPSEGVDVRGSKEKEEIRIKVSPLHYSKMCGLCGNFDGIPHNDQENPEKLHHRSPSCLVLDLILPSQGCDKKPIEDQCKREQPKSPESCRPVERQVVRSRQHKNKNQLCFSVSPVRECKSGCQEVRPRGKVVDLKCIGQDSRQAQTLLSLSHHRPLSEIRDLRVPEEDRIQADVREPDSCRFR